MKLRFIAIALITLVVLLGIGVLALSGRVDSFRPKIQAELQDKLKRQVELGHLSLRLFPLAIKVEGLTISDAAGFGSSLPFAKANEVFVSAGLISLLTGNPQVQEVSLTQPQIELIRNAAGKWNFSDLGGQSSGSSGGKFSLDKLEITDGQVGYTDQQHQQARAVYDHIDLSLSDFALDKKFGVDIGVHFPGNGKQTLGFKGKVGPLPQGGATGLPPVDGHVSLQQVSLDGFNRFAAGTIPPQTDTVATGEADVEEGGSGLSLKGNLKLENTIVKGSKIEYPIEAKYDVSANQAMDKVQVKSSTISLGPTTFLASGDVDDSVKPANLNMHVSTHDSSITALAKLAGAFGVAFSPDYKIDGTLSVDVTAKGAATAPQLNGTISAKNLSASGGEIKQAVSVAAVDLTLTPDSVRSNTFSARSGATEISINFSVANYATKNPMADATMKSNGANIAEVLNIAKAYGVEAAKEMTGTGSASLDVHVQGPTAEPSKLQFSGTASIAGATFTTPELTKPLSIASANAQFSQNTMALSNLAATLGSTTVNGNASVRDFSAPVVQFALAANVIDTNELQNVVATPKKTVTPAKASGPSLLNSTTGGGKLNVGTLKAQEIVLTKVETTVLLNHGLITMSPVSAGVFGGTVSGAISADMRPQTPLCTVKTKMAGLDANALMSAVSSMKNQLYGSLSGSDDLRFALASSAELTRSLNGTLTFSLEKGELKNVNVMGELAKVGKFLNNAALASSGSSTALKELSGTLNIADGVATTNNLKAALDGATMAANGSLNLVNQGINMHATAALTSGASKQAGGAGIGGILNTALANNKGELVLPVLVTGTTSHMSFAPDVQAMAKMKLNGLLPTSANPGQGVAGVLGGLLGGGQKQQQDGKQAPQQQQQNPLNSILDGFKKKKP